MSSIIGSLISEPTSFTIIEQTGQQHELKLEGRALPYRPLTFEGTMRAEITWYPGNPQGTLQVLGAQEAPTTINGMWKDRFMAAFSSFGIPIISGRTARATFNGGDVANIRDLVEIVDGFRLRGQLILVTWDQFTRQGVLTRFRQTWLRREDVEWEMEFQWINRGEPQTPVAFGVRIPAIDILNQISAAIDDLKVALEAPFAFVSSIVNEVNNALDALEQAVGALEDIVQKLDDAILGPFQAARNTLATLQTIRRTAGDIVDIFGSFPGRALRISRDIGRQGRILIEGEEPVQEGISTTGQLVATILAGEAGAGTQGGQVTSIGGETGAPTAAPQTTSQTETAGIASLTQEQVLQAESVKRNVRAAARALKSIAVLRSSDVEAQAIKVPDIRSFTAAEGVNLREVSTKFYGTPDEWKRLLIYNNLKESKLRAGQIILVPPANEEEVC